MDNFISPNGVRLREVPLYCLSLVHNGLVQEQLVTACTLLTCAAYCVATHIFLMLHREDRDELRCNAVNTTHCELGFGAWCIEGVKLCVVTVIRYLSSMQALEVCESRELYDGTVFLLGIQLAS